MTAEQVERKSKDIYLCSDWCSCIPNDLLLNYYNRMKPIFDYIDNREKVEVYKEIEEMNDTQAIKTITFKAGDFPNLNNAICYPSANLFTGKTVYAVKVDENKMVIDNDGIKFAYSNSNLPFALASNPVIPRIEDVQSINDKVVIVKFADGTTEKAVLSDDDTFSLEQGISICITKKILNVVLKGAKGGSAYNKLVDYGLKVYNDKQKEIEKAKAAAKAEKEAEKKKAERIRKKKAKRKAKLREEQIEIQAEAYRRAMQTD